VINRRILIPSPISPAILATVTSNMTANVMAGAKDYYCLFNLCKQLI